MDSPSLETASGEAGEIHTIPPIDTWLNAEPANLAALYAILDDKRHPHYEHRKAA